MVTLLEAAMPASLTLSASAFKAQCLELMAAAAARRLQRVTITKRGKPFVSINFQPETTHERRPLFGFMADSTGLNADFNAEDLALSTDEQAASALRFGERFQDLP